jgi:hypothetical protein
VRGRDKVVPMDQKFYNLTFGRPYLRVSARSQDGGTPWQWTLWYSEVVKVFKFCLHLVFGKSRVGGFAECDVGVVWKWVLDGALMLGVWDTVEADGTNR